MLAIVRTEKTRSNRNGKVEGTAKEVERRYATDTLEALRKATALMAAMSDEKAFRTHFDILEV